jgi:hypothetical protein
MMKQAHRIVKTTDSDPSKIVTGYYLKDGSEIRQKQFPVFTAPFFVAATISDENHEFVNKGWDHISNWRTNYYNDYINQLCMLQISGGWWKPQL